MTDLLEKAIAVVRTLPADKQDDLAHMLLTFAEDDKDVVALTPAEAADIAQAEAEAERGEFATDEDMQALWAKYRL